MAKNIVYLLGAGASYSSIPIVESMPYRMSLFVTYLINLFPEEEVEIKRLDKLIKEIEFYGTPDTLARKHYLSGRYYDEVKHFLSAFLIYEQLPKSSETETFWRNRFFTATPTFDDASEIYNGIFTELDNRYLSFFATIFSRIEDNIQTPSNLSIISWNYDIQIERAYQEIRTCSFNEAQYKLNILPSLEIDDTNHEKVKKEFSVLKLNGTAGFYESKRILELFDPKAHLTNIDSMTMLKEFTTGNRNLRSNLLNFAWENENNRVVAARKIATEKISNAQVLVIIGYSFPDFNRFIDKEIFSNEKLDKIYLQDPNANNIIQKLEGVKKGLSAKTTVITETSNFTIPFEFWED